jgi:hypothetical protein
MTKKPRAVHILDPIWQDIVLDTGLTKQWVPNNPQPSRRGRSESPLFCGVDFVSRTKQHNPRAMQGHILGTAKSCLLCIVFQFNTSIKYGEQNVNLLSAEETPI